MTAVVSLPAGRSSERSGGSELDALARLAAFVCGVPTAAINVLDDAWQCTVAAHGWQPENVPVEDSMCAVSVRNPDVSYTPDAGLDPRWRGNPFVTGARDTVRFYAAAPLIMTDGTAVGTVCAFDSVPRELSRLQIEMLRDIAGQAALVLQLRADVEKARGHAHRDPLTGLPNRELFHHALGLALARHHRGESAPAVLFLDLDGFKLVNDRHGHAAGDALLRAVAERLLGCLRASDVLARFGGDELVLLCEPQEDPAAAVAALTRRIGTALAEPFEIAGLPMCVGASIGAAIATGDCDAEQLVARADAAMYADKAQRRLTRSGEPAPAALVAV